MGSGSQVVNQVRLSIYICRRQVHVHVYSGIYQLPVAYFCWAQSTVQPFPYIVLKHTIFSIVD